MKLLFAGLVLATVGAMAHPAEAKSKKVVAPQTQDYGMTALPTPIIPETPPFHWHGRSSWGQPDTSNQYPSDSANGS